MTVIKTKIGRRSFLKTSAALGGGIMIGFNWLVSCKSLSPENKGVSMKPDGGIIFAKFGDVEYPIFIGEDPDCTLATYSGTLLHHSITPQRWMTSLAASCAEIVS